MQMLKVSFLFIHNNSIHLVRIYAYFNQAKTFCEQTVHFQKYNDI